MNGKPAQMAYSHESPIFVAGCGRSGTTLLRTWLNAHPEVFIPTECLFLQDYVAHSGRIPPALERFLFFREPQLKCWYTGPKVPLRPIGDAIDAIHRHEAQARGSRVWGQKTPRFIRSMLLFENALPGTRWILMYRDPRAVVASMRCSKRHTSSIQNAVHRWKIDNEFIVQLTNESGSDRPDNILTLRYEDMITAPEKHWRRICDFAKINRISLRDTASSSDIEPLRRSRFDNNAIRETPVPDASTTDRWKAVLSHKEIAFVETACAHEMEILGYARTTDFLQHHPPRPVLEVARKLGNIRIAWQYLIHWPEYPLWTALRKCLIFLCVGRTSPNA